MTIIIKPASPPSTGDPLIDAAVDLLADASDRVRRCEEQVAVTPTSTPAWEEWGRACAEEVRTRARVHRELHTRRSWLAGPRPPLLAESGIGTAAEHADRGRLRVLQDGAR